MGSTGSWNVHLHRVQINDSKATRNSIRYTVAVYETTLDNIMHSHIISI